MFPSLAPRSQSVDLFLLQCKEKEQHGGDGHYMVKLKKRL
jgi:hypothetical protein